MKLITTISILLVTLLLTQPAHAQEPVPDTTSAWRYFPLEVGNVWEYTYNEPFPTERPYVERRVVVGDSVVEGQAWRVWTRDRYDRFTGELFFASRQLVRFDTASARVVGIGEPCPFDAPFGAEIDCYGEGEAQTVVTGGYGGSITVSGEVVPVASSKGFYPAGPADVNEQSYHADLGPGHTYFPFSTFGIFLTYARIGGVEYGTEFPVAAEAAPPQSAVALAVFPNPSRGEATVRLDLDVPQRVVLAVYDVLGRRVALLHEGPLSAGSSSHPFDGVALPAGVYFVRATGTGYTEASSFAITR